MCYLNQAVFFFFLSQMQPVEVKRRLWQETQQHGRVVHVSRMTTYIDLSDGNVNHATHNN